MKVSKSLASEISCLLLENHTHRNLNSTTKVADLSLSQQELHAVLEEADEQVEGILKSCEEEDEVSNGSDESGSDGSEMVNNALEISSFTFTGLPVKLHPAKVMKMRKNRDKPEEFFEEQILQGKIACPTKVLIQILLYHLLHH